jgi:hypothetical protein
VWLRLVLIVVPAAIALGLTGCASVRDMPVHLADVSVGHAIDCSGSGRSWNACLGQAGALCRDKGYTVLARQGELEARTGEQKPLLVGWQRAVTDYLGPGPATEARSMVVKCNQ